MNGHHQFPLAKRVRTLILTLRESTSPDHPSSNPRQLHVRARGESRTKETLTGRDLGLLFKKTQSEDGIRCGVSRIPQECLATANSADESVSGIALIFSKRALLPGGRRFGN
jgi:hypothetical protein